MNPEDKLLAIRGRQTVVGVGPHDVKEDFLAYGCSVRVADTQIKSITQSGVAVTDDTNENIALIVHEYIPFDPPISAITLNAGADSVALWLQPVKR